jgi:threonine/homoserine/homoserine lactone efflux protein
LCEIHIDSLFVMWAIGGAFLGWAGMKSYKKWKSGKNVVSKESDDSIDTISK